MPYCSNCGGEVDNEDRFCKHCGKSRTKGTSDSSSRNISKCPRCGEVVNAFDITCRSCGYEFRNKDNSISLQQFKNGLVNYDDQINNTSKNDSNIYKQKAEYIRSFLIPNTKEDIFEFIILSASYIEEIEGPNKKNDVPEFKNKYLIYQAWKSKFEQAYEKAKLSFSSDSKFENIKRIYKKKKEIIEHNDHVDGTPATIILLIVLCSFILFGIIFAITFISTTNSERRDSLLQKESELREIVIDIQDDVSNEDFDSALLKANQLYLDGDFKKDDKKKWDERREEYIRIINEAKEKAEKGE